MLLSQLFHIFANTWITVFAAAPADNVGTQWLFNSLLVIVAATIVVACGARRLTRNSGVALPVIGPVRQPASATA